ncbi:MAG: hypothetical protein ABI488_01265 [Polyangiaceae bacterium]
MRLLALVTEPSSVANRGVLIRDALSCRQVAGARPEASRWNAGKPAAVVGWAHWHFWQFANLSSVPGVHGASDRDRFNGSLAELNAYSAAHVAALPAATGPKNQEMKASQGTNL